MARDDIADQDGRRHQQDFCFHPYIRCQDRERPAGDGAPTERTKPQKPAGEKTADGIKQDKGCVAILPAAKPYKDKYHQHLDHPDAEPDIRKAIVDIGPDAPSLCFCSMDGGDDKAYKHNIPGNGMEWRFDDHEEGILEQGADQHQPAPEEEVEAVIRDGSLGLVDHGLYDPETVFR